MEEAVGPEGRGHGRLQQGVRVSSYLATTTNLDHFSPCRGTLDLSSFILPPSPNVYQPVILI